MVNPEDHIRQICAVKCCRLDPLGIVHTVLGEQDIRVERAGVAFDGVVRILGHPEFHAAVFSLIHLLYPPRRCSTRL